MLGLGIYPRIGLRHRITWRRSWSSASGIGRQFKAPAEHLFAIECHAIQFFLRRTNGAAPGSWPFTSGPIGSPHYRITAGTTVAAVLLLALARTARARCRRPCPPAGWRRWTSSSIAQWLRSRNALFLGGHRRAWTGVQQPSAAQPAGFSAGDSIGSRHGHGDAAALTLAASRVKLVEFL